MSFIHLHNHTQYSILDGACRVDKLIELAVKYGMPAVAMTDHGNMYGAIEFYNTAVEHGIKPIIGIETYIINGDLKAPESKKDTRHHLILLAKNTIGYNNLIKLSTISFTEGFYYKPRISKALLQEHSEGLICLSACLKGEIASLVLENRLEEAEKAIHWYKELFPDRYYLEIMDHGLKDEKTAMPEIIKLAEKTNTPLVVTNDCHYLAKKDSKAHDILLCIQTGKMINDPNRLRYDTDQLYFKSEEEMRLLFPDYPEAFENTCKIASEIDLKLSYDNFLLPKAELPQEFNSRTEYLNHLCYEGAKKKYPALTDEIKERVDYELGVINRMRFEDYFLVVRDLIHFARSQGIPVGPGRGSAAGSIVSYLLDITQICPLEYNLAFERFLNPDRIGMPDIDVDFCAERRGEIIEYLVQHYGRESVAQIITFNTLGVKSVIKDVARVLGVSPAESNRITKMINTPKKTLEKTIEAYPELKSMMNSNQQYTAILNTGCVLEGLIRQVGIHASGVVIGPDDLSNYVPMATSTQKGNQDTLLVQYEGKYLEYLKMLKMDVLGLKTLTIISKALKLIKQSRGIEIDIDKIPLDDEKVFKLLSDGQTDGVFQFESAGMKSSLKNLKPNEFSDLVAMVALYRPGPMQYIDSYIRRKYGEEEVIYDHPLTESALKETYGIIIYQEQVMQISREMCDFTGGEADTLRKAMAKKTIEVMDRLKTKFIDGAISKGVQKSVVHLIWDKCVEFANYAFNKSHSVCYAYLAFQTAYLKVHYPTEFMASVLSQEQDPAKIPYFLEECRNMGIEIISPNINRCAGEFTVEDNKILFGLKGLKNVGSVAIQKIISERDKNGKFNDFFDMCSRIDLMAVNRTVLESLICSGALDELNGNRSQKLAVIDCAIDYGNVAMAEKKRGQTTIFDMLDDCNDDDNAPSGYAPPLPDLPEMTMKEKLEKEKEIIGFYVSGHPLDKYEVEIDLFTNLNTKKYQDKNLPIPDSIIIAGIVTSITEKTDRNKNPCLFVSFEDMFGKFEIAIFNKEVDSFRHILQQDNVYVVFGKQSSYRKSSAGGIDGGILRIIPTRIVPISEIGNYFKGKMLIGIDENKVTSELYYSLNEVCRQYAGNFTINLRVKTNHFGDLQITSNSLKVTPNRKVRDRLIDIAGPQVNIMVE